MSLADALLADLEENGTEDIAEMLAEEAAMDEENSAMQEKLTVEETKLAAINVKVESIRELCKLRDSERLRIILKRIEKYAANPRTSVDMIGNVESDPEYQLIVEANAIAVEIDNEICKEN